MAVMPSLLSCSRWRVTDLSYRCSAVAVAQWMFWGHGCATFLHDFCHPVSLPERALYVPYSMLCLLRLLSEFKPSKETNFPCSACRLAAWRGNQADGRRERKRIIKKSHGLENQVKGSEILKAQGSKSSSRPSAREIQSRRCRALWFKIEKNTDKKATVPRAREWMK